MKIYEKDDLNINEQYKKEIEQIKKEHLEELQKLQKGNHNKGKDIEETNTKARINKANADIKILNLLTEISEVQVNKYQDLYRLEKKLNDEYLVVIKGNNKKIEERINQLELSHSLNSNREETEKLKQKERMNESSLEHMQRDLVEARSDLTIFNKENAILQSMIEQVKKEQEVTTNTLECFDANRRALSEEVKGIKNNNKSLILKFKAEQDKEKKWFREIKDELDKKIADLKKSNEKLQADTIKVKQDADKLCESLINNMKQIISTKFQP